MAENIQCHPCAVPPDEVIRTLNVAFLHLMTSLSSAVHGLATWGCNIIHSSVCFITQWSLCKSFLKSCSGHCLAVRAGLCKFLCVFFSFFVALKHVFDVHFLPFALQTACRDEEIKLQKWTHMTNIDSQHTQLHNSEVLPAFGRKLFQGLKATEDKLFRFLLWQDCRSLLVSVATMRS